MKLFFAGVLLGIIGVALAHYLPLLFPAGAWGTLLIGALLGVVVLYVTLGFLLGNR